MKEKLQLIPQKHKGSQETTLNNYMLTNWMTEKKLINSQKQNLPRLNHAEIEYLHRPITCKEIESVIKNFSTKKVQGQIALLMNSTIHSKENKHQYFSHSSKNRRGGYSFKLI